MKRFTPAIALPLSLLAAACPGDYRETCESDGDCASELCIPGDKVCGCTADADCETGLCIDGYCTTTCTAQTDCPAIGRRQFHCGLAREDPPTIACYPKRYNDAEYGTGHNCSIDGKCGIGWKCMGQVDTVDRYCSPICETDKDCPPKYRCSQIAVGAEEPETRCVRRQYGHPCLLDDQCGGPDDLCIKDKHGNSYCSKACKKDGASCPPFAACEDAGNGKLQCRHKAGFTYTAGGELCDPCLVHFQVRKQVGPDVFTYMVSDVGACEDDAVCFELSPYTNEQVCLGPCTADGTCADGFACVSFRSLTLEDSSCTEHANCKQYGDHFLCTKDGKCSPGNCVPLKPGTEEIGSCF